jgi:hypothetical protein
MPIDDEGEFVKYVDGMLKLKAKKAAMADRLRFCFDFLNSTDLEVSNDAFREYARCEYADYKDMAKTLDPEVLAGWLADAKTTRFRLGLYASLLGHCGTKRHVPVLEKLLKTAETESATGMSGVLAALVMLDRDAGWNYIKTVALDTKKPFALRHDSMRAMRFFWNSRNDLVSKDEVAKMMLQLTEHRDVADFAIEDLQRWKQWQFTEQILALSKKKELAERGIVQRAILTFALHASQAKNQAAARYVDEMKKSNPDFYEETLSLQTLLPPQ